jgi:lipoprotein-anchoring transpeptidase ErfK/SrfK
MQLRSLVSSLVLAGLAAVPLLSAPTTAKAQSLIDFLWGGSQEWGGGRQTVGFDTKYTPGQIIVSFGDRRLYLITAKGRATSYPIAVPREQSRWQGTTTVSDKRVNPSWRPTPDMLKENPKLPSWVPGGHPMNPLGVRAMYLGASTYRIHGTDAPWTIGQAVSKGCIRMYNEDVLDLYPRVPVGMRVTVTWQRFSTQSVADSSYSEPASYGDVPPPFQPAYYKTNSRPRVIRNLPPPPPQSASEAETAAVDTDAAKPSSGDKAEKASKAEKSEKTEKHTVTAAKSEESKPGSKPDGDKAPKTAATHGANSAAEAAKKAAAAAAEAAEAAQKAAEAAKKAAEDAKKASSSNSDAKGPEKTAGKSAAL